MVGGKFTKLQHSSAIDKTTKNSSKREKRPLPWRKLTIFRKFTIFAFGVYFLRNDIRCREWKYMGTEIVWRAVTRRVAFYSASSSSNIYLCIPALTVHHHLLHRYEYEAWICTLILEFHCFNRLQFDSFKRTFKILNVTKIVLKV